MRDRKSFRDCPAHDMRVTSNSSREEMSAVRERVFRWNYCLSHRRASSGVLNSAKRVTHVRQTERAQPSKRCCSFWCRIGSRLLHRPLCRRDDRRWSWYLYSGALHVPTVLDDYVPFSRCGSQLRLAEGQDIRQGTRLLVLHLAPFSLE
jgi:hypothetical protein